MSKEKVYSYILAIHTPGDNENTLFGFEEGQEADLMNTIMDLEAMGINEMAIGVPA